MSTSSRITFAMDEAEDRQESVIEGRDGCCPAKDARVAGRDGYKRPCQRCCPEACTPPPAAASAISPAATASRNRPSERRAAVFLKCAFTKPPPAISMACSASARLSSLHLSAQRAAQYTLEAPRPARRVSGGVGGGDHRYRRRGGYCCGSCSSSTKER